MRTNNSSRIEIALACKDCGSRNYKTTRAKRPDVKPLELKKFCKVCSAHTLHIEAK